MSHDNKCVQVQFRSKHTGEWMTEVWLPVNMLNVAEQICGYVNYYKSLGLDYSLTIVDNPHRNRSTK